jgi:hypothetical protein
MRRKLSLLALALTVTLAGACANPAAPSRDDDEDTERCGVVVGTHTRCSDSTTTTTSR